MLSFDNLRAQLDIMMKKLSTFTKIFSVASTVVFIIFYTFQVVTHLNDLHQTILYSILLGMILIVTVLDIIDLYQHNKHYEYFKKTVLNRVYSYVKLVIVLSSLVVTAYQLFYKETANNLSIVLFSVSVLMYVLSVIFNVTKEVFGVISKRLLVALKMDLEGNILGSVFKEANFDVDNLTKVYKEDELREKIKEETKSKGNNDKKKVVTNPLSYLGNVFANFKKNQEIRLKISNNQIEAYFKKEAFKSSKLAMNKKGLNELLKDIDEIAFLDDYIDSKNDIYYIYNYLDEFIKSRRPLKNLSLAATCVSCFKLLKETNNDEFYRPFIDYTLEKLGKNNNPIVINK